MFKHTLKTATRLFNRTASLASAATLVGAVLTPQIAAASPSPAPGIAVPAGIPASEKEDCDKGYESCYAEASGDSKAAANCGVELKACYAKAAPTTPGEKTKFIEGPEENPQQTIDNLISKLGPKRVRQMACPVAAKKDPNPSKGKGKKKARKKPSPVAPSPVVLKTEVHLDELITFLNENGVGLDKPTRDWLTALVAQLREEPVTLTEWEHAWFQAYFDEILKKLDELIEGQEEIKADTAEIKKSVQRWGGFRVSLDYMGMIARPNYTHPLHGGQVGIDGTVGIGQRSMIDLGVGVGVINGDKSYITSTTRLLLSLRASYTGILTNPNKRVMLAASGGVRSLNWAGMFHAGPSLIVRLANKHALEAGVDLVVAIWPSQGQANSTFAGRRLTDPSVGILGRLAYHFGMPWEDAPKEKEEGK